MNKAITDGINFTPKTFSQGLQRWSRENGTAGSDTYATAPNATFVPADQDFGGALEIQKTSTTTKLRYMGKTPIYPGCYLQIKTRVKVLSGSFPKARIAGWAGGAGNVHVGGLTEAGPEFTFSNVGYGGVVEVSAIVGVGNRGGVDMVWGSAPQYGHFGLDLTGPNGAVVRIDDFEIEDITSAFLRDMLSRVDVRDYGAIGDGSTDDSAAFEAADADANGREILVPAGTYYLGDSVTFQNPAYFEGKVTMPDDKILSLTKNFDLPAYIEAFEDDELAFKKAFQSLLNNADHNNLDLKGRRIELSAPVDMQAAVHNKNSFAQQRIIQNGYIAPKNGAAWDADVETSQATYDPSDPYMLKNVANAASIEPGSLIEGNGVGREVYVWKVNKSAKELRISAPLYNATGTQNYTFRRFKYLLDFSGFKKLSKFIIQNIEFNCEQECSGVLLPETGKNFHIRQCFFSLPKDRGISSHGEGCQGLNIDNCKFLSGESGLPSTQRTVIGFNVNRNDAKIRHNRSVHLLHFGVIAGTSSLILGNHFFQGDSGDIGPRSAGLVLTSSNNRATINGNYICDCTVEWNNEHDQAPEFGSEFSFSQLSITDNVFLSQSTAPSFNFILIKPYGPGHFINGLVVTGNSFRLIHGNIDRVEGIDDSFAPLNFDKFRNITFRDNMFNNVNTPVSSPLVIKHSQNSESSTWVVKPSPSLPFKAWAKTVESVIAAGPVKDSSGKTIYEMPYYLAKQGTNNDQIQLKWSKAVKGSAMLTVRIDDPL